MTCTKEGPARGAAGLPGKSSFSGEGHRNSPTDSVNQATAATLDRLVFTTSRLAEFCSERELVNQTGHGADDWPLVILKESVDNAISAPQLLPAACANAASSADRIGCRKRAAT